MQQVLANLHDDHLNITRILDYLAAQVELMERGENPEWDLMYDVMHYMTNYPDMYHHPKEDMIFARLRARTSEFDGHVGQLLQEHGDIYALGKHFREAIQEVDGGIVMTCEEFAQIAKDYIKCQRDHLELEELVLFPLAQQYLDDADWQAVERAIRKQPDPLFGHMIQDEYKLIRSALDQLSS